MNLVFKYAFPFDTVTEYGAPKEIWISIIANKKSTLFYDVMWVNKTATRLPEATWVEFQPDPKAVDWE